MNQKNPYYANTPAYWDSAKQNTPAGIKVRLASQDEQGNAFQGYTETNIPWDYCDTVDGVTSSFRPVSDPSQGGRAPFNNYKFLNIWVCEIKFAGGYGYYPIDPPASYDGIILYPGPTHDVLAHEFGHTLDLIHTFEDANAVRSCNPPGDEVDDTPATSGPASDIYHFVYFGTTYGGGCVGEYGIQVGDQVSCTSQAMTENLMDYNFYTCKKILSKGQVQRALSTLSVPPRVNWTIYAATLPPEASSTRSKSRSRSKSKSKSKSRTRSKSKSKN
jgi:hypothetical protein